MEALFVCFSRVHTNYKLVYRADLMNCPALSMLQRTQLILQVVGLAEIVVS